MVLDCEKHDVVGDFVEAGVWKGGSSMLMAKALAKDSKRHIYMYDTYQGMTKPCDKDWKTGGRANNYKEKWKEHQKESHNDWNYASYEEVEKNMVGTGYPMEKIFMIKGDVLETIPRIMPVKIAILRLDVDFYAATKHILRHLLQRVTKYVLIDDYYCWNGAKEAVDEFIKGPIHPIDHSAGFYVCK